MALSYSPSFSRRLAAESAVEILGWIAYASSISSQARLYLPSLFNALARSKSSSADAEA